MKKLKKALGVGAFLAATALAFPACGSATGNDLVTTPEGVCAAVVGNGNQQGGNRTVNHVVYPASSYRYNGYYDMMRYFDCGPRNYRVAENSEDKGGKVLLPGRTKDGTPVLLSVTAYWQPNLSTDGVKQFLVLCQKYDCWRTDLGVGSNNSSTDNWQNMLFENMRPTLERTAQAALPYVTDEVFTKNDPEQWKSLGEAMSRKFSYELQAVTGFTTDVFCGSTEVVGGDDTGKNYDCQAVRIRVDGVWAADKARQDLEDAAKNAAAKIALDQQQAAAEIALAQQKYGPRAQEVLACQAVGGSCKLIIGGASVQVQTP